LFRNGQFVQKVVDSVENTGRYVWKIPATGIPPDSSYTLRIMNLNDTTVVGDSPKFTLLTATGVQDKDVVPLTFSLSQNYPNPFNPSTTISYQIPMRAHVSLIIYDMLGRGVVTLVDEVQEQGYRSVRFDAGNLSSGIYFYRLKAIDLSPETGVSFVQTRKLLLLR
jgi:hypothetical protein